MATSSLLGIDTDNLPVSHSATGIESLGPSDASDSGSDSAGAYAADADADTDRHGTGERGSVDTADPPTARDILPDHVESMGAGVPDNDTLPDDAAQADLADVLEADRERGGNDIAPIPRGRDDLPKRPLTGDQGDKGEGAGDIAKN